MTEIERMDITSGNAIANRLATLRRLCPEVFTETSTPDAGIRPAIDCAKLQRLLGHGIDVVDEDRERYSMTWPGKGKCLATIQRPSVATLKPDRTRSVYFDTTENVFIDGDNLEVLKLLQKAYFGKVKTIFIDPPYNTGKDFIYPDDYTESLSTYLAYTGQIDDEGKRFSTNADSSGRYHSKWLTMMYPRVYLAKNLLRDDGFLFVTIDDTEVANLRKLLDEVFGEENFVANVVWQKKYTRANDAKWFSDNHDHVLVYAAEKSDHFLNLLPRNSEQEAAYSNPDGHPKGNWKATPLHAKSGTNTSPYTFKNGVTWAPPQGTYRRFNNESMRRMDEADEIWFGPDGKAVPSRKSFLCDVKQGVTPVTIWPYDEVGHNHEANNELKELLGEGMFDNPKPTRLVQRMIQLATSPSEHHIVFDFFAGSGTTAHAVTKQNAEDGGNRRYICVQLPEPVTENSPASKAGYHSITDIGIARMRALKERAEIKKGEELTLETASAFDDGFRVFKLDRSNFHLWDGAQPGDDPAQIAKQLELHEQHIDPNATQEDLLYELLLKAGFPLTTKVEKVELAGKEIFSVAKGALLICLQDEITKELIKAMADTDPFQVICLDSGFKNNDQLKANAVQTFKTRNKSAETATVFRTV
jgi:adenine-specific DNA-methyltransferase